MNDQALLTRIFLIGQFVYKSDPPFCQLLPFKWKKQNEKCRIFFETKNNGAVFSTGSIAFGQSLPSNNFNNSSSIVMKNVINAFMKDGKLPGGLWTLEEKQWK